MKVTSVEGAIERALTDNPHRGKSIRLAHALQSEGERLLATGMDPAAVCAAFMAHVTGLLAAGKMAGKITHEFAELLISDLSETVLDRALVGTVDLADPEPLDDQVSLPENDVFVSLGNMASASLASVKLDKSYELMVEDIIGNFNHIVSQGVKPIVALYAFSQAYALTLGQCLRADLPWAIAQRLLRSIMKNAQTAERMLRQVTR